MNSVSCLEEILKEVLEKQANELARTTGFIQRQRALTGAAFVQGLVFGWLHQGDATSEALVRAVRMQGVQISAPGLSQRFTPQAATFLQELLRILAQQVLVGEPAPIALLQRFQGVIIEDSSIVALPDELAEVWKGCGGNQRHTEAAVKLHVRWDLLHGTLQGPILTAGRVADQSSPLRAEGIAPGTLYITDEGYFALHWLKEQLSGGGFFLTRPRYNTAFFDSQGHRLDLQEIGPQVVGQSLDRQVLVGTLVRLPARLIMVRVPEEVIEHRREQIRQTARKHGTPVNPLSLALAAWTILITNVEQVVLSVSDVLVLQRSRWQIERLFRLWKEHGKIDEWRTKNPWRILCEVAGKLMAMLIQHWVLLQGTWHDPARSLVKAAAVVRTVALDFLEVFRGQDSLAHVLCRLQRRMQTICRVNRRASDPALFQLLLAEQPLSWLLT